MMKNLNSVKSPLTGTIKCKVPSWFGWLLILPLALPIVCSGSEIEGDSKSGIWRAVTNGWASHLDDALEMAEQAEV